jgi:hypothetical protein
MLFYTAFHRGDYLFAATRLGPVLAWVRNWQNKSKFAEDATVWAGPRLVAIVHYGGIIAHFDVPVPCPEPPPAA